jgi:hypothetical protein
MSGGPIADGMPIPQKDSDARGVRGSEEPLGQSAGPVVSVTFTVRDAPEVSV